MSKKINLFNIGASDFINRLLVLSTADPKVEMEIDVTPIQDFISQNKKDLENIGIYVEEATSKFALDQTILQPPESIEIKTNNLITKFQQVVNQNYPSMQGEQFVYNGISAYYKSVGIAKFFQNIGSSSFEETDNKDYFGHCLAFGSILTKSICAAIMLSLEISSKVLLGLLKIHKIPIKLIDIILAIVNDIIKKIGEELKPYYNNKTGMICFYFDRVDTLLNIHDKFDPKLQPLQEWQPSNYYSQADWEKIF